MKTNSFHPIFYIITRSFVLRWTMVHWKLIYLGDFVDGKILSFEYSYILCKNSMLVSIAQEILLLESYNEEIRDFKIFLKGFDRIHGQKFVAAIESGHPVYRMHDVVDESAGGSGNREIRVRKLYGNTYTPKSRMCYFWSYNNSRTLSIFNRRMVEVLLYSIYGLLKSLGNGIRQGFLAVSNSYSNLSSIRYSSNFLPLSVNRYIFK